MYKSNYICVCAYIYKDIYVCVFMWVCVKERMIVNLCVWVCLCRNMCACVFVGDIYTHPFLHNFCVYAYIICTYR